MKNFVEGRDREYKYYYAVSAEEKKQYNRTITHIKVAVSYYEGGMNYFSGVTNVRGYRMHWTPMDKSGTFESYSIMGDTRSCGAFILIEEAKRYNARRLAELAERYDSKVEEIAKLIIKDNKAELIAAVKKEVNHAYAGVA